jgi:hypothetical protein
VRPWFSWHGRLFSNHFKNVVFISVGVIDSGPVQMILPNRIFADPQTR